MQFRNELSDIATGTRTKRAHQEIVDRLLAVDSSLDPETARRRAAVVLETEPLGLSLKQAADGPAVKTGQLLFFRDADLDTLAAVARDFGSDLDELPSSLDTDTGEKPASASRQPQSKNRLPKEAASRIKTAMTSPGDALDVALFGRMVAELPAGNVDAACQVAHAIGTHRLAPEYDYYTAVDDLQPDDTEGADMIGTVQFNASCLYRYAAHRDLSAARGHRRVDRDPRSTMRRRIPGARIPCAPSAIRPCRSGSEHMTFLSRLRSHPRDLLVISDLADITGLPRELSRPVEN